jgi:hypothetical protein
MTGGWADVSLVLADPQKGAAAQATVTVNVKGEPIDIARVYVKLQCREEVHIPNFRARDRDDPGDMDYVDVRKEEEIYDQELTIAPAQRLEANQTYTFEGAVEIPAEMPPTYRGRHCKLVWRTLAGLDMKGNDPDSGWQEFDVP